MEKFHCTFEANFCERDFCEPKFCEPTFCEPDFYETNFCEPGSHDFSVNFDLWFTYFHSSQKSREPVNHGSQITQAPLFFQQKAPC